MKTTFDHHEWVDLGLPSGTLWATCNVGASRPEEYGDYFAWGETEPQPTRNYSDASYKFTQGKDSLLTKYCADSNYGAVDNKTELELVDDAACVNWGSDWCMPTRQQFEELMKMCMWRKTNFGFEGTGPNGRTIVLPTAGYITQGMIWYDEKCYYEDDNRCFYWSSTLAGEDIGNGYSKFACTGYISTYRGASYGIGISSRPDGCPVRPVRRK